MVPPPELGSENCKRAKKRRKEFKLEGTSTEGIGVEFHKVANGNKLEPDLLHDDTTMKDLPAANGDQEQQIDKLVSLSCLLFFVYEEIKQQQQLPDFSPLKKNSSNVV